MPTETATATDLVLEEATSPQALGELRAEWAALWARCLSATPFQLPAWLIPWWQCFGTGELWTLTLRQDGRLVGLAPLFVGAKDEASMRTVRLLGTGNTDYLDVLLEPGFEEAGMAQIVRHLDRHRARWDRCDFQQLRADSPLLDATAPEAWLDETAVQEACPVLALPDRFEEQADYIPTSFLKDLRYYRRRAERTGTVVFESVGVGNQDALFGALLRLHRKRWAERDETGVLADEAVQQFHERVVAELHADGRLRLYALRLDGQIIASYYGFTDRTRHYYYLSGFDPAFSRLSPGHQIVHHAIKEAIGEEDIQEFDFLRGQEEYKYRWGAEDRLNRRRQIQHASTPAS